MGAPLKEVYPEVWKDLESNLSLVVKESETLKFSATPFLLNRDGYLEECYFDYTLSPITSIGGEVAGVFNVVIETTSSIIAERRKTVLNQLILLQNYPHHFNFFIDACGKILNEAFQEIPIPFYTSKGKIRSIASSATAVCGSHWIK